MAKAKSKANNTANNAAPVAGDGSVAGAALALEQRAAANNAASAAAVAAAAAASAPVAVTLAADVIAFLRGDGETAGGLAASLGRFAELFRPCMATDGHPGDFVLFRALRKEWCIGYDAGKRGVDAAELPAGYESGAAGDAFLYRLACAQDVKRASDGGFIVLGGETPKSQSAAAVRMSKKRELPAGTAQDWTKKAQAEMKAGNIKAANDATANAARLIDAEHKAATKAATERVNAMKDQARELLRSILASGDEKRIKAAVAVLTKLAPVAAVK